MGAIYPPQTMGWLDGYAVFDHRIEFPLQSLVIDWICVASVGLLLAPYCLRYPHTIPFWGNKITYSLFKYSNYMLFRRRCSITNALNLGKKQALNFILCPFTELCFTLFVTLHACHYFINPDQGMGKRKKIMMVCLWGSGLVG